MYPKAIDSKGNLKKGLNVDKLIKEDNIEEGFAERQREKTKSQQKAHQKRMIKIARKSIKDYEKKNKKEEIDENADASLKKKSEKSGISVGILKQVYNRGVAAWKTGHRPGTTPEQWGHARVNSFITKGSGTWGKADKDLAKKAGG
jgi:phage-related minor tail protein